MPSKNMLPKGKRRQSVRAEYRKARTTANEVADAERLRRQAEEFAGGAAGDATEEADDTLDGYDTEEWAEEIAVPLPDRNVILTTGATGSKVAAETQEPPRYGNPYANLEARRAAVAEPVEIQVLEEDDFDTADGTADAGAAVRTFTVEPAAAGMRLDAFLARALPDVSRARVQALIEAGKVRADGKAAKASLKLRGGERIELAGDMAAEPLTAEPEDIPLDVVYEDRDLLVIDKAAGMQVHAGAGGTEHNRGTLVNALLFYLGQPSAQAKAKAAAQPLSTQGGALRPGIVHRLDKDTSGLILVARNDVTHRELSRMFADREVGKVYLALVHGAMREDEGTVRLPIGRDPQRRIRMSTRVEDGRPAVSHWRVLERFEGPWGAFTLLRVRIETGRTHQIRVHMAALGHRVVGDTLYGAPERIAARAVQPVSSTPVRSKRRKPPAPETHPPIELGRNFLHAAELRFRHPRGARDMEFEAPLPAALAGVLEQLREHAEALPVQRGTE